MSRPDPRTFWVRHSTLLAVLFVGAVTALDLGPESWMEWIMWGTTVVTVATARILLAVAAVAVVVAVLWPFIRPTRHQR